MHIVKRGRLGETLRNTVAFHANAAHLGLLGRLRAARATSATLADTVAAFNAKTVVLTVTAGRTGTDTVSQLLKYLPDTHASHEPNPNHRFILARVQSDPAAAARFFRHLQAPSITARPGTRIVESSHLFCKGFFEPCIAMGFRPALLMLERDKRTTALSHLRKNSVPGRSGAGYRYVIAPTDRPYLRIDMANSLSDYQLCYWYCLEIELRQALYGMVAKELGMVTARIRTDELSDPERLTETCVTLGLADAATARAALEKAGVGTAHNATPKSKSGALAFDPDAEEAALRARLHAPADADEVWHRIEKAKRLT